MKDMYKNKLKESEYMAMTLGMVMASGYDLPYSLRKPDNKYKKCLLHGCTNATNHNGGYCCASHCKRHKIVTNRLKNHGIVKRGGLFKPDASMIFK